MTQRTLTVTGMSCGGCEENVETELSDLAEAVQAAGYELDA